MYISWKSTLHSARDLEPGVAVGHPPSSCSLFPSHSFFSDPHPQSQSLTSPAPRSVSLASSPSSHPKKAQGFFLILEGIAFSQRKEGGGEEKRKISFFTAPPPSRGGEPR